MSESTTASPSSSSPALQKAKALLQQANALRDRRQPGYAEVYRATLEAIADTTGNEATNLKANVWTNHGIALLDVNKADALNEAVSYFERAIDLRKTLPMDESPYYPWGLSAAWMNRAEALTRLEPTKNSAEILRSYDEGLNALSLMPRGSHPSLASRIALAWMNRGLICQIIDETGAESLRCLNKAEESCDTVTEPGAGECKRVLIGVLLNRAIFQLGRDPKAAWKDAREVLVQVALIERFELLGAEAGLRARHIICQILTQMPADKSVDWVTEATDAVDDGMALARTWATQGGERLQPLIEDLFRFGLKVYQVWQPHFLAEFILDSMDPDKSEGAPVHSETMHHQAIEAIWSAVVAINKIVKSDPPGDIKTRFLETLEDLQAAEKRLTELRGKIVPKGAETAMV